MLRLFEDRSLCTKILLTKNLLRYLLNFFLHPSKSIKSPSRKRPGLFELNLFSVAMAGYSGTFRSMSETQPTPIVLGILKWVTVEQKELCTGRDLTQIFPNRAELLNWSRRRIGSPFARAVSRV